jgi:hypothetical protein
MSLSIIVAAVPVALGVASVLNSGWQLLTKLRARRDLSLSVRESGPDVAEVNSQLEAKNLEGAIEVIRKHLAALSPSERREAEAALTQPSAAGRASYVRGVTAQGKAAD